MNMPLPVPDSVRLIRRIDELEKNLLIKLDVIIELLQKLEKK